jgi:putative ABC transport system ATP-binding protein
MNPRVFAAHGLTKTYTSGEVAVHALRGLDLEIAAREVAGSITPPAAAFSSRTSISRTSTIGA